jgi:transcriptional regulator with XRE-family HTH domain
MTLLELLRREQQLSQRALGVRADISNSRVSAIEGGSERPKDGSIVLARLATALGFDGDPATLLQDVEGC